MEKVVDLFAEMWPLCIDVIYWNHNVKRREKEPYVCG
jgi:hypothetical protein